MGVSEGQVVNEGVARKGIVKSLCTGHFSADTPRRLGCIEGIESTTHILLDCVPGRD